MTVAPRIPDAGTAHSAMPVWPPTGTQTARKPAGGFIDCPVEYLTLPWWLYQQGAMGFDTLRVWLGTLELVEKRCGKDPDTPAHYGPEELRRLLRAPRRARVQEAVQRLEDLGLLAWSPQGIQFLPLAPALQETLAQDSYQTLRAQLPPGLRWVPVPRRLLVWLAQEGQPGLIATACGVLLRCMRYKARQCVAGGRVATPWIATVFGVAERTVQRAMQVLQGCGWLARLAGQPARERPHGRYTVINLAWQRPGARGEPRDTRTAAATTSPEEPAMAACHNLSPLQGGSCQNLSPVPEQDMPISAGNIEMCGPAPAPPPSQPFQEARHDPEPTGRGPAGTATREGHEEEHPFTTPLPPSDDELVTEDDYAAATARLLAQGLDPAFLIRPVVVAEVHRVRDETARGLVVASGQTTAGTTTDRATPALAVPLPAPAMCAPTPQMLSASGPTAPACASPPPRTPPPTLREVTLADLGDVDRLLALHQQAMARGWVRGGEAERLHVVAAAVHARRVGQAPCRLFVALLRDQRWEVITQEDEDQACWLLRAHRDGPCQRTRAPAAEPEVPLPDDARFVLLAEQVLRQAGWRGDPFLAVHSQYPGWTHARWERAQAALAQWQRQQAQARQQGSLDTMALPWEDTEAEEAKDG